MSVRFIVSTLILKWDQAIGPNLSREEDDIELLQYSAIRHIYLHQKPEQEKCMRDRKANSKYRLEHQIKAVNQ